MAAAREFGARRHTVFSNGSLMATIYGSTNSDSLDNGTATDDVFVTSLGGDYVLATAGNDSFNLGYAKSASYWKHGINDFDQVDYRYAWQSYGFASEADLKVVVDLQLGTVRKLDASSGALMHTDTLIGVDGVYGTAAADKFYGRDSWDFDLFNSSRGGDFFDGRGGSDGVSYSWNDATQGIVVKLAAGQVQWKDDLHIDTLREIEWIRGTNFADTYIASGYGAASTNKNSSGQTWNLFDPRGGDDSIIGNGSTTLLLNNVGGAVNVNLGLQTSPTTSANIVTAFTDDTDSSAGFTPGKIVASGVIAVRGGNYNDKLYGGGKVNSDGALSSSYSVSGDLSFEAFRGNGGNDTIDGRSGYDRAEYNVLDQVQGITVKLAAGTVVGDPLLTGKDILRGIESINSTFMDDVYDARGFTLSSAAGKSLNHGDVRALPPVEGETLASDAFNEFRAYAGNDTVIGNGATRVSFGGILVEDNGSSRPSVELSFSSATAGSASYGNADGGFGTVKFSGVYSVVGSVGNDRIAGAAHYQALEGDYGNDTLMGGDGNDYLAGFRTGSANALNPSTRFTDNDTLDGGAGNDLLYGAFGDDKLIGGSGADQMHGGTGNDIYYVDNSGDKVVELANAGTDTVHSGISWTLGANVERLVLTGSSAINGTGNTHDNVLTGNSTANTLRGGNGNDTLNGGAGNDVLAGGAGNDRLSGGAGNDVFQFDSKTGSDTITDFNSAADTFRFSQAGLRIGDGDNLVDGFALRNAAGGFSSASEVVVFTPDIAGALTTNSAAAAIGSASSSFASGSTRLFVVDNGTDAGLFLFTSSAQNATVSASELTQLATFHGTTTLASDYVFMA